MEESYIESLQNSHVKNLVKLRERKHRNRQERFIIEGYREIKHAIVAQLEIETLYYCPELFPTEFHTQLVHQTKQHNKFPTIRMHPSALNKASLREGPDGLIQSCTIVTTAAPSALETYHHRSPLMLNGDALLTWLDGSSQMKELEGLLEPSVPFSLRIQDVDRAVNQVRRKDQAAQRPIGPSTMIAPDVGADH